MRHGFHHAALLLVTAAFAGCSTVQQPDARGGGATITVAPERVAQCQAQGGCALISRQDLMRVAEEAYDLGATAGKTASCRNDRL